MSTCAAHTTVGGRNLVVGERVIDDGPSQVYLRLGDVVVDGGPVDPAQALAVQMRLPDGQGWIVAAYGAQLRWRQVAGTRREAGYDTALLPDGADLQVECRRGAAAIVIPLT